MGFALSDMQLSSLAFDHGNPIPARHTGEGSDISPAMCWRAAPSATRSFALFCHDPDAPLVSTQGAYGFVHWLLYNIPASVLTLEEGVADFARGVNSFGKDGYGGPMPPPGHGRHHYFFWLLALDVEPDFPQGLELQDFLQQVEPHILGMNRLVGTYERRA
jgi:hypothetical protein